MAPRYARALEGDRAHPISMRSPGRNPATIRDVPNPAIRRGNSSGPIVRWVAASMKHDRGPKRSISRPAKFPWGLVVNLDSLGKLRSNDAHDLANTLHFHQVVYVQRDPEDFFEATCEGQMAHGVPERDVIGGRVHRHRLRVDVKGRLECLLDFGYD